MSPGMWVLVKNHRFGVEGDTLVQHIGRVGYDLSGHTAVYGSVDIHQRIPPSPLDEEGDGIKALVKRSQR
jgi:hypothetical protein